jgi:hypothetical protein
MLKPRVVATVGQVLSYLLSKGASLTAQDDEGRSVIFYANKEETLRSDYVIGSRYSVLGGLCETRSTVALPQWRGSRPPEWLTR